MPKQDCATFCLIIRLVNSDTFYVNSVQSSTTLFYSQKHNIFCYNPVMVSVMSNVQKSSIYITWILLLQLLFLQIIAALVLLPFNKTRVNVQPHNHIQSLAFKTWDTNFISLNLHSYDAENRSRPSKQIWGQLCSIQTNIREKFYTNIKLFAVQTCANHQSWIHAILTKCEVCYQVFRPMHITNT